MEGLLLESNEGNVKEAEITGGIKEYHLNISLLIFQTLFTSALIPTQYW